MTCDQSDPRRATDKVKQVQHGEAAIAHENHISTGQGAGDQLNDRVPLVIRRALEKKVCAGQ